MKRFEPATLATVPSSRWVLASLFVLAFACVAACESRVSLGATCTSSSSCADGLRCEFGHCRAQCVGANDCPSGALCIGDPGVCTLTTDTCDAVCAAGLICSGTVCAIPCSEAIGCRGGSICDDDTAVCVSAAMLDGGLDGGVDGGMDAPVIEALDAPEAIDAVSGDVVSTDAVSVDAGPISAPLHRLCTGFAHACVIRGGRVYCWGANDAAQLGDSTVSTPRDHVGECGRFDCSARPELPVLRTDGASRLPLEDVVSISCGTNDTCALTGATGQVWCWGAVNEVLGPRGVGGYADYVIASRARSIEVGRGHACAHVDDGVQCWGENVTRRYHDDGGIETIEDGRLGSPGDSTETPRVATALASSHLFALGGLFTCRLAAEGVRCLGLNEAQVTGREALGPDPAGTVVAGIPGPILDLSASTASACVISEGTAHCWGGDLDRILASATPECPTGSPAFLCRGYAAPVERGIDVLGETLVALSHGVSGTMCALTDEGRAICWGWNILGQAGVDPASSTSVARLSSFVRDEAGTPLSSLDEIGCGAAFCCARRGEEVFCWGENDLGQLGRGDTDSELVDGGLGVIDAGPGSHHSPLALPHHRAAPVDLSLVPVVP